MFSIDLNDESAAVLLRCLSYGESAISGEEVKDGTIDIIQSNVRLLRDQVSKGLSTSIICKTSGNLKPTTPKLIQQHREF